MGFCVKLYGACVWNPVPGHNYSSSDWKPLCTWVYKRRSRGLQWELPKLHCTLIWLRNEFWVRGRSSTKLMVKKPIPGHLFLWNNIEARIGTFVVMLSSMYCCFCMWHHSGHVGDQEQKRFSPLGTKHHFALTTNMAALSCGCKPRIGLSKPI